MDEADKYKQRLEAIAEKRRLQEEQERARRDMEDEKLRLQQLKRKSLRDQWLMEGAPLSPTSPDPQGPRSPLLSSQVEQIEKHRSQSESQWLAGEEKLNEQMGDGQTESVKMAEEELETVQDAALPNGGNKASGFGIIEDEVKTNQTSLLDEAAFVLTNGGGDIEADVKHHDISEQKSPVTNGPIEVTEDIMSTNGFGSVVSETGLGEISINEEEQGTLIMRAERVIITDEGDDVPEDLIPQDQQTTTQSEETPQPNPDACMVSGEAVERVMETEVAAEMFTELENSGIVEHIVEVQSGSGDENIEGDVEASRSSDGETKDDADDNHLDAPASVLLQSTASAPVGAPVALVPVYSESQTSSLTTEPEAESAVESAPEGAEAALTDQSPATMPGQFQEVPLTDPQENHRTEAEPGEQEPLLTQVKAPNFQAEPAAASSQDSTETHSPIKANRERETEAPKQKSCQCCSVM